MTDNSFKNWVAMSDRALTKTIGHFVKHHRLDQNKTQDVLAKEAGISRSTLSLLEKGSTVTLDTFIRVVRTLDQLYIMEIFAVQMTISPMALAKLQQRTRKMSRLKNRK